MLEDGAGFRAGICRTGDGAADYDVGCSSRDGLGWGHNPALIAVIFSRRTHSRSHNQKMFSQFLAQLGGFQADATTP